MFWKITQRLLLAISVAALSVIAYTAYMWVDYYTLTKRYTYIGDKLVRIDNTTSEVQTYDTKSQQWWKMDEK